MHISGLKCMLYRYLSYGNGTLSTFVLLLWSHEQEASLGSGPELCVWCSQRGSRCRGDCAWNAACCGLRVLKVTPGTRKLLSPCLRGEVQTSCHSAEELCSCIWVEITCTVLNIRLPPHFLKAISQENLSLQLYRKYDLELLCSLTK